MALSERFIRQAELLARCRHAGDVWGAPGKEMTEGTIPARFAAIVERFGERIAVCSPAGSMRYAQLDAASNRAARMLLERTGAGAGAVMLLFAPDVAKTVATYAVLKAGKFFVALNPGDPIEHNLTILRDCGARALVTDAAHAGQAHELARRAGIGAAGVLTLTPDACAGADAGAVDAGRAIGADEIAYLLYTSGSTGRPKGVMHTHRSELHATWEHGAAYGLCAADRTAAVGAAGLHLNATLLGATATHFDFARCGMAALGRWMAQEEITYVMGMPSALRHFLLGAEAGLRLPHLRAVLLAGEPVLPGDVRLWRERVSPHCVLVYGLAMSEAMRVRRFLIAPHDAHALTDGEPLPVGYATEDKEIALLDEAGNAGCVGEIAVRSRYLAAGYWGLPERTRARFVGEGEQRSYLTGDLGRSDADGCLFLVGRRDDVVKVRGQRVAVQAVELALSALPWVREAAVIVEADADGERRLTAYVRPTEDASGDASGDATGEMTARASVSEMRRGLGHLPDAMIPTRLVRVDALPLGRTGKVDRDALQAMYGRGGADAVRPKLEVAYVPPRSPLEQELAQIWAEVLGLDQVGRDDPFLELGGHSLAAMRIVARVRERFGCEPPLETLLRAGTVGEMAEAMVEAMVAGMAA